jgi:hypothetical protein
MQNLRCRYVIYGAIFRHLLFTKLHVLWVCYRTKFHNLAFSKVNDVYTATTYVLLWTALFCVITQEVAVILYLTFGTTVVVITYRRFWSDRLSQKVGMKLPLLAPF